MAHHGKLAAEAGGFVMLHLRRITVETGAVQVASLATWQPTASPAGASGSMSSYILRRRMGL